MSKKEYVMGINLSNHDRSASILCDGEIVVAISEERLDRRKHSQGFYANQSNSIVLPPFASINYCLDYCKISIDDLSLVVVGRSITTALETAKKYIPIRDKSKIVEFELPSHHSAHAFSAYFASGFESALVVIADEQGSWINSKSYEKVTAFEVNGNKLTEINKQYGDYYNISLGMFYDLFSYALGFSDGGLPAAGKTMGLAAYGHYDNYDKELITFEEGNINININNVIEYLKSYKIISKNFNFHKGKLTVDHSTILDELKKFITPIHWNSNSAKNIAWRAQNELEKILLKYITWLIKKTGSKKLCLAGGTFLNSVSNTLIYNNSDINDIYIYPASTDDGTAVGLAYKGYYEILNGSKKANSSIYLGKVYSNNEIENTLKSLNIRYMYSDNYIKEAALAIHSNKIIAFFHSSSEFGPRALGNRSILANPCSNELKIKVNRDIKHRESFRPLAPIVLEEHCSDYFDLKTTSPYMLLIGNVKDKSLVGITHHDNSARIQTVNQSQNSTIYNLVKEYGNISGKYVVLNTSFNVNGEPLVETPFDAIYSFFTSDIDILFLDNFIISKEDFSKDELEDYFNLYVKKEKNSLLILSQWEYSNNRYVEGEKYLRILKNTSIFNELNDQEKIQVFYLYSMYYESLGNYDLAIEYIDKIINNTLFQINFADIYLQKVNLLSKVGKDITIENKISSQLQRIEAEGLINYVKKNIKL